jgi:hypothetical protein
LVGSLSWRNNEVKSVKDLVAQANSRVDTVTAQEAMPLLADPNTVFADLRDSSELMRDGKIPSFAPIPANAAYLSVYFPRNGRIG